MLNRWQLGCLGVNSIINESSEKYPLEKTVHVDEFEIGTRKRGEQVKISQNQKI